MTLTFDQLPNAVLEMRSELADIKRLLSDQPTKEETPQWLSIDDLIEYLPSKPAKQTIYGLVNNKKIPCHRINGKLFFDKEEINQWIEGKRIFTKQEIELQAEKFIENKKGAVNHG